MGEIQEFISQMGFVRARRNLSRLLSGAAPKSSQNSGVSTPEVSSTFCRNSYEIGFIHEIEISGESVPTAEFVIDA
jgi:hypothetical protein